ncbi:hypothetical protein WMF45_47445 [Sorangium sp. So ce448]|uniref:hypothetical protein n=1 Tax=unclassified Sorangium TaxID=2621164 RepID=UPI003F5CAFB2
MTSNDPRMQRIEEAARKLARRLASEEGKRALAKATEATLSRIRERQDASRVDPKLLQKRVTL